MTKDEINELKSEIIRLQQIVMNHYLDRTRKPIEGDEMQPHRDKLKELRKKVFGDEGRGETIVYSR